MIFHDGRLVRGTWTKADLDAPLELSTKAGELTVPAGHTWIELVPRDGGNVTFSEVAARLSSARRRRAGRPAARRPSRRGSGSR